MGLIDSSLKYTSIGSVRLHASAREEDGRLQLRFDIVDTGVGLSKAVKDRLFQPCIEIDSNLGEVTGSPVRAQARQAHGRRHRLQERGWPGQPLLVHASGTAPTA